MTHTRKLLSFALIAAAVCSLSVSAHAADYSFTAEGPSDYYGSTSYEDIYGSRYNYGGPNVVDYQIPELEYGSFSTTQTGLMEKTLLPGLQKSVYLAEGGTGYGITADGGVYVSAAEVLTLPTSILYQQPAYTSADGMERSDGSIGTLKIPSLGINMKVWEGETSTSMSKGLGHYSSTSAWDGNVAVCGHNRGSRYAIGDIKDMGEGDLITYTTIYGTRTYAVTSVEIIASNDWSSLQATSDNRITLTTCLANNTKKRVCVQAVQINE